MSESIDVLDLRSDTPGLDKMVHMHHCGASLMPAHVLEAVTEHLTLEAELGGYEAARVRALVIEDTYDTVAELIHAGRDEIALCESATVAWDRAFYALAAGFEPGDRILTCNASYASNYLAFLQVAQRTGAVVEVIPDDEHGQLDVRVLHERIDDDVALMALTHVPTNGGLVNPAVEVGRICNEADVPYLLDACQSVGQLVVDVDEIGCDFLSATGRKFLRGPRGTGFLYMRREWVAELEPHTVDLRAAVWTGSDTWELRSDARRFETWERSVAGQLGLRMAIKYAMAVGLPAIEERVTALANRLREGLAGNPRVTVRDKGVVKCGIVSFTHDRWQPGALRDHLRTRGFHLGVSDASSTRLDMDARGLDSVVRAGLHYVNTEDEVDRLVQAVAELPDNERALTR